MPGEIKDLDIKIKLLKEFVYNGGVAELDKLGLVDELSEIKVGRDGKVMPETVSRRLRTIMSVLLISEEMPPVFSPKFISYYSSTIQKKKSFEQINIETEEQFDAIYEEFKDKTDIIFRGQGEAKWRLYSTLQRKWIEERLFDTESSYQEFLDRFVKNGKTEYEEQIQTILEVNHIDTINTISVLGYLQHHKCPTPLLDWTYSFGNALFFALEGITDTKPKREIDEYFSVYYLEEEHFEGANVAITISEAFEILSEELKQQKIDEIAAGDDEMRQEMIEHFAGKGLLDKSKLQGSGLIERTVQIDELFKHRFPILYFSDSNVDTNFIYSLSNNENIKNQKGVLMWNRDSSKPMEMITDEYFGKIEDGKPDPNYHFCKCFNIKKELAGYIRAKLEADGITKEFIYPAEEEGVNASDVYEQSKTK
jgi:hypothetical protein